MGQWVKVLATKLNDLSLIPEAHRKETTHYCCQFVL